MRIRRSVAEEIVAHALSGYPYEVCGVLVGDAGEASRSVVKALRVENRERDSPRVRYQIAPEDLIRIQRQERDAGREIVGYYHSHPDHPARPSETDRRIAAEGLSDGVVHVVVGVEGGRRGTPTAWVFREATGSFEAEPFEID
jgi:proteasome lid subunit RPN8/RPN11